MFVLGGDFTSGPGFLTAELFTVMIPLVMLSLGIGMGAGATAGEEQEHTIDLLLANPLSRRRVVVEKFLAVLAALAAVGAMLCGVLWVGASMLDMGIGIGRLAAATAGAVLLGAAFAAVALAVGCTTGRKPVAVGVAVSLALAGFLVNSLAPMVEAFQPWRKLTLFYQYIGADPLRHGLPAGHAAVLAAVTLAAAAAAVAGFARRDLGT
jgi:ABC-2 type transport system permease protein